MNYPYIASYTNIPESQVISTIQLLDDGATLPFIARYRKEATGGLDEVQIGDIREAWQKQLEVEKRRIAVVKSIDEQRKLTDLLRDQLGTANTLTELEDLYLPYKQKRKTRATMAIERGLEPLAKAIFSGKENAPGKRAASFVGPEVPTVDDALQGARDIMAEWISEDPDARRRTRTQFRRDAVVAAKVKKNKEEEGAKYRDYFAFSEPLVKIPSHRLLALRRAETEGILSVSIVPEESRVLEVLNRQFVLGTQGSRDQIELAVKDSYKRLLRPAIETEFANLSKEKADAEAIRVFADNLRPLLLAAPLGQKRILAVDPGYRTGCKTVALDENGELLENMVLYPFDKPAEAQAKLQKTLVSHEIEAIAVGNGTAGRETEEFINKTLAASGFNDKINCFLVSEQGASIYSASDVAREEFPQLDLTVRGAISIGRRLMDPLAELVKIDPKSIGVGQYQHDVDQSALKNTLDTVVESCVNAVGINLNTASKHLLRYVAGLGPALAQNIVDYRAEKGGFQSRAQLLKVPRLGAKAYEQAAGFLRIEGAKNPLDNSAVHPERYAIVQQMATDAGSTVLELIQNASIRQQIQPAKYVREDVGLPTLKDILQELEKPSRDPRAQREVFAFDAQVRSIDGLRTGMVLPGIVTNITAFGAFVDVGVKQDGLVHVSQMADRFVKDPNEIVKLQQEVRVTVMEIDVARKRIALSMKGCA